MQEIEVTGSFGSTSTTDEALADLDLNGKLVLVTGVCDGLGVETAPVLVRPARYRCGCGAGYEQGSARS